MSENTIETGNPAINAAIVDLAKSIEALNKTCNGESDKGQEGETVKVKKNDSVVDGQNGDAATPGSEDATPAAAADPNANPNVVPGATTPEGETPEGETSVVKEGGRRKKRRKSRRKGRKSKKQQGGRKKKRRTNKRKSRKSRRRRRR